MEFEKDYFNGGSNYEDYTKKKYFKLCKDLRVSLGMNNDDLILDFGCATGNLLHEFKELNFNNLTGTDISVWAIEHGKRQFFLHKELQHYNRNLLIQNNDWVIMLDVLEHMDDDELNRIQLLLKSIKPQKGLIVRIPVSAEDGEHFVLPVSRNDKTHIQIHSKKWWLNLFNNIGFKEKLYFSEETIYDSLGVLACVFEREK